MYKKLSIGVKQEVHESDFANAISVTVDGRVYYFDHVLLGFFSNGKFTLDREAFNFIKGKDFYSVRRWIYENWNYRKEALKELSYIVMDKIFYGSFHIASSGSLNNYVFTEKALSLYSEKQLQSIVKAAR